MNLLLIVWGISFGLALEQPKIEDCDQAYILRPEKLVETTNCYYSVSESLKEKTSEEEIATRKRALEMSALAASWNAIRGTTLELRTLGISLGERASNDLMASFEKAGSGYYWSAIFQSAKAKDQDGNALIPTHTLKVLPKIKAKLRKTIELDETVHGYGAHRVLGIIYTTVPGLVGGDKELGEKYFKTSLEKAPRFSINPLYYGKYLVSDDRKDEAREIMKELIEIEPKTFDPDRIQETTLDQKEAEETLK
ncbi:MAG: hypothetical protein KA715_07070 [Xanthomonadaceae bacterium]|nr:hypothetical protein [Xanthomonadaceae bacterium]